MKRSLIIFIILLVLTLALPAAATLSKPETNKTNELVTIFSAELENSYK